MEEDIFIRYLKYLLEREYIDIEYLETSDNDKFISSNIHKLTAALCMSCVNMKSNT